METNYEYKVGDYVEVIEADCFNDHPAGIKGRVSAVEPYGHHTVLSIRGPEVRPYVDNYEHGNAFLAYQFEVQLTDAPEPLPDTTTISSIEYQLYKPGGILRGVDLTGTGDDFHDFLTDVEVKDLQRFLNHHFGE